MKFINLIYVFFRSLEIKKIYMFGYGSSGAFGMSAVSLPRRYLPTK